MIELSELVKRALIRTVVDIGQLSRAEIRELDAAVRKGWLSKGRGGPYPALKTVWGRPELDFAADREYHFRQFQMWHALDVARGVVRK